MEAEHDNDNDGVSDLPWSAESLKYTFQANAELSDLYENGVYTSH